MNLLEVIAQRHKMWVSVVRNFGIEDYAEDIVQEMYIKAHKYIEAGTLREQTVNTYVYTILRSLCIDLKRAKKSKVKVSLNNISIQDDVEEYIDLFEYSEFDKKQEEAHERILLNLEKEIEGWHWFDKMLFKDIYVGQDLSMRGIEEKTNISLATIFNTIKRCKQKCIEAVGEDVIDFKNEEYERI